MISRQVSFAAINCDGRSRVVCYRLIIVWNAVACESISVEKLFLFLTLPITNAVRVACYWVSQSDPDLALKKHLLLSPVVEQVGHRYPGHYPFAEGWYTWDITPLLKRDFASRKIHILLSLMSNGGFSVPFAGGDWQTRQKLIKHFAFAFRPKLEVYYEEDNHV